MHANIPPPLVQGDSPSHDHVTHQHHSEVLLLLFPPDSLPLPFTRTQALTSDCQQIHRSFPHKLQAQLRCTHSSQVTPLTADHCTAHTAVSMFCLTKC